MQQVVVPADCGKAGESADPAATGGGIAGDSAEKARISTLFSAATRRTDGGELQIPRCALHRCDVVQSGNVRRACLCHSRY